MGSMIILSRLLSPRDFGLVAMATALTGFLLMFRDLGLSAASIQSPTVTHDQLSTLFWLNVAVGVGLTVLCAMAGPLLARFYGEPELIWITAALATGFLLNGVAAQHRALLGRHMQFTALAVIDTLALVASVAVSIIMAATGFGYWAVVVMNVGPLLASAVGALVTTKWIPGPPRRNAGVRPLLKFGGTVTLNSLVVYVAYNVDKALLGRFWGADALGLYRRAYQLINLPTDGLNSALSGVALPALARVQQDPPRLRRYFVQGYGVFLSLMIPLTVACALFADDIVHVFLGAKWSGSAAIFRLLTPTMLVFSLINPLSWMLFATGRTSRSLKMALLIAPVAIIGYSIGVHWGPAGVATGFSAAMLALALPLLVWACYKTPLRFRDIFDTIWPAGVAAVAAGAVSLVAIRYLVLLPSALFRLTAESAVLFASFGLALLVLVRDRSVYLKMWHDAGLLARRRK
jgi:PST family polysaccharide transporter